VVVGFVVALLAATISTIVASRVFGELDLRPAYFLLEEPIDKIATALIVFIILKSLPKSILQLFPRPENTRSEDG
jgi:hypothetical protein